MKQQFRRIVAETRGSIAECQQLCKLMRLYQVFYRIRIKSVPSTLDLSQLYPEQVYSLSLAMEYDKKAGEAAWALYETQKKLCDLYDFCESSTAFLKQHFVRKDKIGVQDPSEELIFARARSSLRRLGPRLVQARRRIMAKVERG